MAGEIKETADKKALEISRADVRLSSDPKLVETTSSSNDIPEDTPRNMADAPASDENTGIRSEIKQATGKLKGMATSMFNSFEQVLLMPENHRQPYFRYLVMFHFQIILYRH